MLTAAQLDHYRTFGFILLPGLLGPERTAALRAEVDAALHDAYATTYDERVIDGISGHYLPMASRLTPVSASLICDDPVLIDAAQQLVGGAVLPECPEGVLYFEEAWWHHDDGIGVNGVKFATYFDHLEAGNGALRFVPGSHVPDHNARLYDYRARCHEARAGRGGSVEGAGAEGLGGARRHSAQRHDEMAAYPGHVPGSRPGDVFAFDLHTWHASFGGRDRLAWSIVYERFAEGEGERERTHAHMADSFEQAPRGFDRDRYPVWRDWLAGEADHPRRTPVIERMRAAGVLDLPGAQLGW